MKNHVSCSVRVFDDFADGVPRERIPHVPEWGAAGCHDCGTPVGGLHHPGCDVERCPRCEGQAITCGCADVEEDELSAAW
jgi:hypothetical protein